MTIAFWGGAMYSPTTSAALAANSGSLLSHQDLRPERSTFWARKKRQPLTCSVAEQSFIVTTGGSQPVASLRRDLYGCRNPRHSGRLGGVADSLGRDLRPIGAPLGAFWTPVS